MVVYAQTSSTWEAKAGELKFQGQPGLCSKYNVSLGYKNIT